MATKERPADAGARRAKSILIEVGTEIRKARLEHGLSQLEAGGAARLSRSSVSRIERGDVPLVPLAHLARLLAVVGLELSARAYPAGNPIRDAAHRALLERFRAKVSDKVAWRFEVPLPIAGDQRAWDAVLVFDATQMGVEAETRPRDLQALQRRLALKRRDDPRVGSVILVMADTRHNRQLMQAEGAALREDFPIPSGIALQALVEGRDPGGSGVILL